MKTLRIISLIALSGLLIVLGAHPAATQAAAADKVIKIYASWSMQGSMIPEGTAMLNAAKMALDEVNGEAAGYKIELIFLDDAAFRPAWGAIMAHMTSFDKARRARLIGYMGLAENIGETGGPLLAGFVWNVWGAVVLLVLRAVIAVVTEIYGIVVMRSIERGTLEQDRAMAQTLEGETAGAKPAFDAEELLERDREGEL